MDEDLLILRGYPNGRNTLYWPICGAVDRVTVYRKPVSNRAEAVLKLLLNYAVRLRAHIQQEISAPASYFDQRSNKSLSRFVFAVVRVISPGIVDRHARFPQLEIFRLGNRVLQFLVDGRIDSVKADVFGRDSAGNELLRRLVIPRKTNSIVNERGWLQFSNQVHEPNAAVFFLMMQSIEPDQRHGTIAREELGQLQLHVV